MHLQEQSVDQNEEWTIVIYALEMEVREKTETLAA
jgi:hypothetical protein